MVELIGIGLLVLLVLSIGGGLLWVLKWDRSPVHWEVEAVVNLLQSVVDDDPDYKNWDYFQACAIKNPDLECIRGQCLEVCNPDSQYLDPNAEGHQLKLSQVGIDKFKMLIAKCSALDISCC